MMASLHKQALRLSKRLAGDFSFERFSSEVVTGVMTAELEFMRPWECSWRRAWKHLCSPSSPPASPPPPASLPPPSSSISTSIASASVPSASTGCRGPACSSTSSKRSASSSARYRDPPSSARYIDPPSSSARSGDPASVGSSTTRYKGQASSSGPAFGSAHITKSRDPVCNKTDGGCMAPRNGRIEGLLNGKSSVLCSSSCLQSRRFSSFTIGEEFSSEEELNTDSTFLLPEITEVVLPSANVIGSRLPALTEIELSFDEEDVKPGNWVNILDFLLELENDPFPDVPANGLYSKRLSTDRFRIMERDILLLAAQNRKRGYDIAEDLHLGNVFVSRTSGRIRLGSVSGNLISDLGSFKGYQAAGLLFDTLLGMLYAARGVDDLSDDNAHLLSLLAKSTNDDLVVNHASLLTRPGRIGLTLKLPVLFRNDIFKLPVNLKWSELRSVQSSFYKDLPYTTETLNYYPTDQMHTRFEYLRSISGEHKYQDRTQEWLRQSDRGGVSKRTTGSWLVSLNRNGVLRPPMLLQVEIVDMLHSHTSLYLPVAQQKCHDLGLFELLEMKSYFPAK